MIHTDAVNAAFFFGMKRPANFYFIRHGESEGNVQGILQGRLDFPLSAAGREQAAERGRLLRQALAEQEPGSIRIRCSPLRRAWETAEIMVGELFPGSSAVPIEPMEDLQEMRVGEWTGMTMRERQEKDPLLWKRFRAQSWDAVPGAENSSELYRRALRIWGELRETVQGEKDDKNMDAILAISHYGIIQWIIKSTLGCRTWFPEIGIDNCSLSSLQVEPQAGMIWNALGQR